MKRILTAFATLALALSLGVPMFGAPVPKTKKDSMAKSATTHAKHHKMSKKSGKKGKSAASKSN